jgi:cytochrome bd-type quinol oxidase subunit 2
MQTLIQPEASTRSRSRPLARSAWWPALVGALVPKCPMCVAAYLSALGAGASTADSAAPAIVRLGHLAVVLAVAILGARLLVRARRVRRYRGVAAFGVCALGLLVAEFAAPMLLWPRLVAVAGVAGSVVFAERANASGGECCARGAQA